MKNPFRSPWVQALLFIGSLAILGFLFLFLPIQPKKVPAQLGYTFSVKAAQALNLDPDKLFTQSLADLKPAVIRLPVYWDLVEPKEGTYDWTQVDSEMAQLEKSNTKVILAIGLKLPRWPECHSPGWVDSSNEAATNTALFDMLKVTVDRYKNSSALLDWQVENEELFPFGSCPSWIGSRQRLAEEITYVRSLDAKHPIITTDTGELSLWWRTGTLPIDALAISLYRSVYDQDTGIVRWNFNPYFYVIRRWLIWPWTHTLIVSELEMEPWGPAPVQDLTTQQIEDSFHPAEFQNRLDFAQRVGAQTVLAWGVEWWYYMDMTRHDSRYLDQAKQAFAR